MLYKSLSLPDVRRIYGILEECRQHWDDPAGWQTVLLREAAALVRLPVGLYTELLDFESGQQPKIHWIYEHGWRSASDREAYYRPVGGVPAAPFSYSEIHLRFRERIGSAYRITCTRADLMPDGDWQRCRAYRTHHAPARMTEVIYSAVRLAAEEPVNVIAFGGDTCLPGRREREIVELLHQELAEMVGTRLSTIAHISRHGLSPRLSELLGLLCEGLPEKEIATAMNISRATISEHIQRLYRHFEVRSRAELMAYLLERKPRLR